MPIVWNDKARAQLPPRTREAVPAFKHGKRETIWAAIKKSFALRGKYDPIDGTFVKGRTLATPEHAKLMEACETLARAEEPPALDDLEVAAAFFVLTSKLVYNHPRALVLATLPVPRAFQTYLRAQSFAVTPHYVNWNDPFRLIPAPPDSSVVDLEWRASILAQTDEVRAECKQIARDFWAGASLGPKTTIAWAFFDEKDWSDEVCNAWLAKGVQRTIPLNAMVSDFEVAKKIISDKSSSWDYMPLIERFGDQMLPVIIEMADKPFDRYHAKDVAEALSMFDDPLAAASMVKLLNQASSRPLALSYFGAYPHYAEAALASVENMKGRAAKIAREVLTGAQRVVTNAIKAEDEATNDELPRVLGSPPWLDDKKPKRPVTNLDLPKMDRPETVDWQPGDKERALRFFPKPDKPATEETLADYAAQRAANKFVDVLKHKNEALPEELVLEAWNAGQKTYGGTLAQKVMFILAKYGDAALPGLSFFVDHLANGWGDATFLVRIKSYRLALPLATHITHRRIGKLAWTWLTRHAELAVLALVPHAFGDDKDARANAERALFRLKASGVDVIGIGAKYGKEAKAALDKLFSWDPIFDLPKTIPKLGPAWHPQALTRPRLHNGKPLSIDAMNVLAAMLAFSPLDPPYAGIPQVKEACEPRSLAEFSWDAARAWEHAGHKKKEQWMLQSLVHFADDEVVRRLTPGVRVDFAVQVLEVIATDAALMEMATIAGRTSSQGSEWTLGGKIEKILANAAEARGVSKDELEEDLAPTADLDEEGALSLDYGARRVKVGFDESLVPYVKNEGGARGRALAPARKDDDLDKAEKAKAIWRDLKEDVQVIAQRRIKALERAMITGRTWTFERFERVWLDHSLMKHMARGVVWRDVEKGVAFRVCEDGSLANVNDEAHDLESNAKIGVAHPLKMPAGDADKWRTTLEDYKIVQPFAQLGRNYVPVSSDATRMAWPFASVTVSDLVQRLTLKSFQRGPYIQGKYTYQRPLPRGGNLYVEFKNNKAAADELMLAFREGDKEIPASQLDSIELADAIYDLQG
jgi:hypothetical protein